MFFLNRKEKALAKQNKKIKNAQRAYDGYGKCYTCKYKKKEDGYYGYIYRCKLHFPKPREEEKCEYHTYDRKSQKDIDYIEKKLYKDLFQGGKTND